MEPIDLHPLVLPPRAEDCLDWGTEPSRDSLSTAGAEVDALKDAPAGDEAILQLWNDAQLALGNVFALSSLMSVVHPEAGLMEAAEGFQIEAHSFSTDLHLDADVYGQLSSIDGALLEPRARRVL